MIITSDELDGFQKAKFYVGRDLNHVEEAGEGPDGSTEQNVSCRIMVCHIRAWSIMM